MSVGYPAGKNEIDFRIAGLVQVLRDTLVGIDNLKAFLDGKTDTELQALGYSATDVTALRGGLTDLVNLAATARGQRAQTPASNFLFNAIKFLGPS